jgi:hypothetical protein
MPLASGLQAITALIFAGTTTPHAAPLYHADRCAGHSRDSDGTTTPALAA